MKDHLFTLPPPDTAEDLYTLLAKEERPILLYGMGNGADKMMARLSAIGKEAADVFASDAFVRGQHFHGKRVLRLSEAEQKYGDFLILVCFGSTLEDVYNAVYSLAEKHDVRIPDLPVAGEEDFTAAFYRAHYRELEAVYHSLADDTSKRLYAALVRYKLTGDPAALRAATADGDIPSLLSLSSVRRAVDVGAYRGDTLASLAREAPTLSEVYAIEPDEKNFAKLSVAAAAYTGIAVHCIHGAAWETAGELSFSAGGNRNSTLTATASYEAKERRVRAVTVDEMLAGRAVDLIKYDTEGAEREALIGSAETLRLCAPRLRVSIYHRSEDLFAIPALIERLTPDTYRYYIRRRACIPAWEIELLAVPKGEKEHG